jgi:hypothetical protein
MYLLATKALGLLVDPGEQLGGETLCAGGRDGRQVVDVEMSSPRQAGALSEANDGESITIFVGQDRNEPVTGGPLDLVDLLDEVVPAGEAGSQFPHGVERQAGVRGQQLRQHVA